MTDSMQAIQGLLPSRYCKVIEENHFELREGAENRFSIIESPDNVIQIPVPAGGKAHSGIIESSKDYKRSCDFLIIEPDDKNVIHIYFIEIKETLSPDKNGIPKDACKQIFFTTPVWKYLCSMAQVHFGSKPEMKEHFVVLAKKTRVIDKQPTNLHQSLPIGERRYRGKNFKIIHSLDEISFKDLKCQAPNPS